MAQKTPNKEVKAFSKKAVKKEIAAKLESTMADYKAMIGEKKFKKSIKKLIRKWAPLVLKVVSGKEA